MGDNRAYLDLVSNFQGLDRLVSTNSQTITQLCCEYCGNTSGKKDGRGGCISCGAYSKPPELITKSSEEMWSGRSGGYDNLPRFGMMTSEEFREMYLNNPRPMGSVANIVRRSVGL